MSSIAIIDDHPVYRDGLAAAITGAGHELSGQFESVEAYLATAAARRAGTSSTPAADLVLLDYHLPGAEGATAVVLVAKTGAAVLMVSADVGRDAVLATIAAGAMGYVSKHADVAEILRAIDTVTTSPGSTYVSPQLAAYMLDAHRHPGSTPVDLTFREQQVLSLVAAGERDRDIAESLYISIGTVRAHLAHIRTKTGRHRRAELTRYALERGVRHRDR